MTKTLFRLAASAALAAALAACATRPAPEVSAPPVSVAPAENGVADLTLEVRGVRAGAGPVMIVLFGSEAGWNGEEPPVRALRATASDEVIQAAFDGLAAGDYGVRLFQDLDGDGEMDANPFGIPTEPYGFSNDAPVRFGPPSWAAARFRVAPGAAPHVITLPE